MILNNCWLLLKMKKDNSKLLDEGIDEITSGRHSLEEWLSLHPEQAEELRPLLEVALNVRNENLSPSPQFRQRARMRLWQEMEKPTPRFSFIMSGLSMILRPFHSLRTVALVVPLFLVLGFGSALNSSRSSLPDDTLYGLKTGLENLNVSVTMDPVRKSDLRISLVERRIDEVILMNQLGRTVSQSTLDSISTYLEEALYQGGSESPQVYSELLDRFYQKTTEQKQKLEERADANQRESSPAIKQVYAMTQFSLDLVTLAKTNPEVLRTKICLAVPEIENGRFNLRGQLAKGQDGIWTIDGKELVNIPAHDSKKLTDGAMVTVKGICIAGSSYVTDIETAEDSDDKGRSVMQMENNTILPKDPSLISQKEDNPEGETGSESWDEHNTWNQDISVETQGESQDAESNEVDSQNEGLNPSDSNTEIDSPNDSEFDSDSDESTNTDSGQDQPDSDHESDRSD